MWAIHPVLRDEQYYGALTRLIERVEHGATTPEQLGEYNVHPSMLSG
jgi:hypothetical protein